MIVGVLGGTGAVGARVVSECNSRGHRAVTLARTGGRGESRRVDVVSGEGLREAMAGLDALVDVLNGPPAVLVDGLTRALAAARECGVAHVVSLSVLGADRVPMGYYQVEMGQEAAVQGGGVPWSIVRSAQFHSLVDKVLTSAARRGVLPLLRVPLQPVDPHEVAVRLVDQVEAGPAELSRFAGPRVERADRAAWRWARVKGVRRLPVPVPAVGPVLRAIRAGGLTDPTATRGQRSFEDWLRGAG